MEDKMSLYFRKIQTQVSVYAWIGIMTHAETSGESKNQSPGRDECFVYFVFF